MNLSVVSLLISNILVIILAIVQKWDASTVLWVYWMQSIIIGFFQFLRILLIKNFYGIYTINNKPNPLTAKTKIAFFFAFHYGFFHFIYAIFLFQLLISHPLDFNHFLVGGLIFFSNHLYSFYHNMIVDKQKSSNIAFLMLSPYARIIPMHLVIIIGVLLTNQALLILFLILKTVVDLLTHIFKHRSRIIVS